MERTSGVAHPGRQQTPSWSWKLIGQYLPVAALALAAFLILKTATGGSVTQPPPVTVASNHREVLAANISFFEGRVAETKDSLSYNRLTNLYLQRARETGDVSDIRRAELSATKSLEAAPGAYPGRVNLGLVRLAQHDFVATETLATELVSSEPGRAEGFALLGDAQMALGKYDAAGESYRTLLDLTPGPAAFARQAALAEARGNVALAGQFWQAAIDADRVTAPADSAWARVQLANLHFTNGDIAAAAREFGIAQRVFPGYGPAVAGEARVAAARGDYERATRLYEGIAARYPTPETVIALGETYERAGRATDAERQYALVRAIDELYAANGIKNDLTLILFALDHGGEPVATLERARLAYDERPSLAAADVYAWALYRAGRLDEAAAKSAEALRLGTKEPGYLFHAGMIALARGERLEAREYLEQALALNPAFSLLDGPRATAALQGLKETK